MENRKWLKRKYPESFEEANLFLNDSELSDFKKRKYKLGRLIKNVWHVELYKKDCMIVFKRSNPINDECYPAVNAIIKCNKVGITQSGYHSICIYDSDFKELSK